MHVRPRNLASRALALLMALVLCLSLLPVMAGAQEQTTYTQVTSAEQFTTGTYYMVTDTGYAPGVLDGSWVTAVAQETAQSNALWTLTVDGDTVTLQDQNGTYIAPKGGNNNGIQQGEYTWSWSFENGMFVFAGQGDDTVYLASNRSSENKFRAYKTTTVEGNPNGYPYQFTLYKAEEIDEPVTVAAPQAQPQGGEVAGGTEITLTCATAGASIYYTLDGSQPTTGSALYAEDNKPVITQDCTLKAMAVLEGVQSEIQSIDYTVEQPQTPSYVYQQITTLEELTAGGNFVIVANTPSGYLALGTQDQYDTIHSLVEGVSVNVEGNTVTGDNLPVWTVEATQDGISLSVNGEYLNNAMNNGNLDFRATSFSWIPTVNEDGTFWLKSGSNYYTKRYLAWKNDAWNPGFWGYGTFNDSPEFSEQYCGDLLLFRQQEQITPEPEPDPGESTATLTEEISEGDIVTIYYPAEGKVMSSEGYTYNSKKDELVALEASVDGDTMTLPEGAAQFKVYEQDGHYVLKSDEGFLYLDGTHVRLVEEQGEYTLFDLEQTKNGWFVKSTNAQYYGKDQYLEYYGGYFTCYGMGSNTDLYTFQFYLSGTFDPADEPLNPGEGDQEPIADGDQVVIYDPAQMLALSATVRNSYYPIGVAVEEADGVLTGYGATEVWTVGGDAESGYTFTSNGGQTLSMAGSYSSVYPGAGDNETWTLEAAGEGTYYLKNAGRGNYLRWDSKYDNWTTSADDKTAVAFRVVDGLPEEPDDGNGLEVRATPVSGATLQEGDTIELSAAQGAAIYYTTDGTDPTRDSAVYTGPLTVGTDVDAPTGDQDLVIRAMAVLPAAEEGGEDQVGSVCSFTYKAPMTLDGYSLYFGQLHSHTNISDGAGSVEEAFEHASQVENLDFLAVTDHSNSFDNESDDRVDLGTDLTGVSSEWAQGHEAAAAVTDGDFVGLYGFEMTWSDGFGHINTFNTPGFESRSNSEFGNKSGSTQGYQNYYDKLVEVESSLSQFNHPGTTFGDFQDFAFYDPQVDQRITLIEVGNGEGAIGSSGYFPSYEYYTRVLDKGWHVAPTNNQDNHKGNWGDSNTARSVVLADALTEDAIYDAIANYRVYATEDNDLSILYSLNGNAMGSILGGQDAVDIQAQISDPTDSGDMKVEVIVNGGLVIGTQTVSGGSGTVSFHFDSNDYSYYYLRITQADQNIAVTAPVWTGEGVNAGISQTQCDQELVVRGEEVTISSELYNNAGADMTVQSLVYTVEDEVIYTADPASIGENGVLASGASDTVSFPYAFPAAGQTTVDVTMSAAIGGTDYTFTSVLQLEVTDASLVTRILVDGTHYNDYVTGYYSGNMGNFTALAAQMGAQVTVKQPGETITAADLEGVSMLVISAPLKTNQNNVVPTEETNFSEEFIQMVADYARSGGTVILCGLADYQDSNNGAPYCSTEQINPILEAMGATMRLNDDEVLDDDTDYNGGDTQTYRVYMDNFNTEDFAELFEGLQEGQVYSAYSGASVDLGENGQAIVRGSENCYSINSKTRPEGAEGEWDSGKPRGSTASGSYAPDTAVVQKGDVVTLATEAVGEGRVYLAGTVFLSDFEISDSSGVDYGDASYANKVILQNIISSVLKQPEISTIAEARQGQEGDVFTVQGVVTAGNVEPNAFFDTIYIQDETGGIDIYPVSDADGTFQVGQRVQVSGSWDQYQGDVELRVIDIALIDSAVNPVAPTALTLAQANDYAANGGWLAKVSGTVKSVETVSDQVSEVILTDGTHDFRLLFNNYIGYSDETSPALEGFVREGAQISAAGIVYYDPDGACLRIRDRSEVTLLNGEEPEDPSTDPGEEPEQPGGGTTDPTDPTDPGTGTTEPGDTTPGGGTDQSGGDSGQDGDTAQSGSSSTSGGTSASPKTGDDSRPVLWGALLLCGVAGVAALVVFARRKKGER